jgi:hypothetical protein
MSGFKSLRTSANTSLSFCKVNLITPLFLDVREKPSHFDRLSKKRRDSHTCALHKGPESCLSETASIASRGFQSFSFKPLNQTKQKPSFDRSTKILSTHSSFETVAACLRVESLREGADEVPRVCCARCGLDLSVRGALLAVRDVLSNGHGEQVGLLAHQAHALPERLQLQAGRFGAMGTVFNPLLAISLLIMV